MTDKEELPTIRGAIESWLGIQLPAIPMPQTIKNLDKAISKIVLASGENAASRIRQNARKAEVKGKIEIDGMYRTEDEKRRIENRIATTKIAIEELGTDPGQSDAATEIEDDWLNLFGRLSEDKSSEELQHLFGKILSGEIRRPGSFSLRTVSFMATISKTDAEAVSKFLSYSLDSMIVPFVDKHGPSSSDRLLMEELGVAGHPSEIGGMALNCMVAPKGKMIILGIQRGLMIENITGQQIAVAIGGQALTSSARELISIAGSPPTDLDFLKKIALKVRADLQSSRATDLDSGAIAIHVVSYQRIDSQKVRYDVLFTAPKPN